MVNFYENLGLFLVGILFVVLGHTLDIEGLLVVGYIFAGIGAIFLIQHALCHLFEGNDEWYCKNIFWDRYSI